MRTFRVFSFLVHEKKSCKGLFYFHICSMVFISLVMWSWLLSHIKGSYGIGIVSKSSQTSTHAQSIVSLTSYYLFQARTQEGVRGVRTHPLAGQTISKSCRFSPEAEFKHLLLASQLGFSWDSHPLYFKRKHIWHECQSNIRFVLFPYMQHGVHQLGHVVMIVESH